MSSGLRSRWGGPGLRLVAVERAGASCEATAPRSSVRGILASGVRVTTGGRRMTPDILTDQPADLVLTGGPVVTMDSARRTAEACAVRDGRIVAVGLARDIDLLVGTRTRRID